MLGCARADNQEGGGQVSTRATAHDAAVYILERLGKIPAVKLHKLLYYAQAWSLVWDDRPLFREGIEAWANGPVVPAVYSFHRGKYAVHTWPRGDARRLDELAIETLDIVLEHYGGRPSRDLVSLTHREDPWKNARGDLPLGQRSHGPITQEAMMEYYSSLVP